MRVKQITTPALPITLVAVKDHLRIEQSETIYDDELTSLICTAQEWIFATCHLTLTATDYEIIFEKFPCNKDPLRLPVYPLIGIDSIFYATPQGTLSELVTYQTQDIQVPVAIYPFDADWPETDEKTINAVFVKATGGYVVVPELAKHLIKLLIGHWFKNREAVITGTISKEIEISADNLMKLLRVNEFEAFV
jgi:uncharacterized phiE125 gp8 family phage protein